MAQPIYEKKNTPPAKWGELLTRAAQSKKDAPEWAKQNMSRAELKASLIIDGEVYRPYYVIDHAALNRENGKPFNYLMDFTTAHALEKHFNKFSTKLSDRISLELVLFSSNNNRADRR